MGIGGIGAGDIAALIVAVSFAAGLNVYATVLTLGVAARMNWVQLPGGLEMLGHTWVIGLSAVLFAGEFVMDKVPGVDLVWNALHTFVRVPVAALLAYGASAHLRPELQVLATCVGGVLALVAHGSKTAVRAAVTPSPEPVSNVALSTAEDAVAVGLTWTATHHPVMAGVAGAALTVGAVGLGFWAVRVAKRAGRRVMGWRTRGLQALERGGLR